MIRLAKLKTERKKTQKLKVKVTYAILMAPGMYVFRLQREVAFLIRRNVYSEISEAFLLISIQDSSFTFSSSTCKLNIVDCGGIFTHAREACRRNNYFYIYSSVADTGGVLPCTLTPPPCYPLISDQ